MSPYRVSCEFTFECDLDLALTYALRRPRLALSILADTYRSVATRPDLQYRVRELATIISTI